MCVCVCVCVPVLCVRETCAFIGERERTSGERSDGPGRSGGMDSEERKDVS